MKFKKNIPVNVQALPVRNDVVQSIVPDQENSINVIGKDRIYNLHILSKDNGFLVKSINKNLKTSFM